MNIIFRNKYKSILFIFLIISCLYIDLYQCKEEEEQVINKAEGNKNEDEDEDHININVNVNGNVNVNTESNRNGDEDEVADIDLDKDMNVETSENDNRVFNIREYLAENGVGNWEKLKMDLTEKIAKIGAKVPDREIASLVQSLMDKLQVSGRGGSGSEPAAEAVGSGIGDVKVSEEVEVDEQAHEHLPTSAVDYVNNYFDTIYLAVDPDPDELRQRVQDVAQLVVNFIALQDDQAAYEKELEITQQPITAMLGKLAKLDISTDTNEKRALFIQAATVILDDPHLVRKMHICMNTLINAHNMMTVLEKKDQREQSKVSQENFKDFADFVRHLSDDLISEFRETESHPHGSTPPTPRQPVVVSVSSDAPAGYEHLVVTNGGTVTGTIKIGSESAANSTNSSIPAEPVKPVWGPNSVYSYSETETVELNKYNFDRAIEENEFVFVLFYAPWCHRSQTISKEFEETRRIYRFNGSKVLFAKVNGHENIEIRDKQSIGGYPVVQLYRRTGGNVIPRGPTHPYSLAATVRRSTLAPIEYIESMEQYEQFLKIAGHSFIGVFPNNSTLEYHKFVFIAKKLSYKIPIGYVNSTELAKEIFAKHRFSTPISGVILAIPQENIFYLNRCDVHDVQGVFKWLTLTQPSVNELSSDNLARLAKAKKASIVMFLDYNIDMIQPVFDEPLSQNLLDLFTLAHEFKSSFDIYYADGVSYRDFYERLGLTKIPSVAIIDVKNETHYLYPADQKLGVDNLRKFFNGYLDHGIEPYKMSDSPVDYRNTPSFVSKTVYSNFNDMVINSKKNSLVYFYEPWCGFCKTMNIYYEKAGEELVQLFGSFVQVLNYDVSINSVPAIMKPIIDGYPHISLFLGDDTQHPITYNGSRSVESLIQFVKSHIEKDKQATSPATTQTIDNSAIDYQKISLEMAEKELQ